MRRPCVGPSGTPYVSMSNWSRRSTFTSSFRESSCDGRREPTAETFGFVLGRTGTGAVAQRLMQSRLLCPAVHARRSQTQPLRDEGSCEVEPSRPQRGFEQRAHEHVALRVRAAEDLERAPDRDQFADDLVMTALGEPKHGAARREPDPRSHLHVRTRSVAMHVPCEIFDVTL